MTLQTLSLNAANWHQQPDLVEALSLAYAVDFWGGTWKELLALKDDDGEVIDQFGTFDVSGETFPETIALASHNGVDVQQDGWPMTLWQMASNDALTHPDGRPVHPYWSLDRAREELTTFVGSTQEGGYGGEIVVLLLGQDIVGFTAFTCLAGDEGREVAHRRYPISCLYTPVGAADPIQTNIRRFLESLHPGDVTFGILLDHAISEAHRGNGLGAKLFDARLKRIVEVGADVVFGRTMITSPAQYFGNYTKRGLTPLAEDGTDEFSRDKHYFVTKTSDLIDRPSGRNA